MKESYEEQLAIDFGHKPYAGSGDAPGVAWVRGDAGQPLSSEINNPVCRPCTDKGKATSPSPPRQGEGGHGGVGDPVHVSKFQAREPGEPEGIGDYKPPPRGFKTDRWFNVSDGNDQMHTTRKSDGSIIPAKSANKGTSEVPAEWMEVRDPAERNAAQPASPRTQSRNQAETSGLDRVRGAARKDGDLKFTALLHHADVDALRRSYFQLKKTAAVGIDEITWQDYGQALEENLIDLHGRIHRGSYRAKPSRRRYIDKPDGRKRALGIASLEDKIVQHAVAEILQSVCEVDFLGFTHKCARRKSDGSFIIHRHSMAKRMRAKLLEIREKLRKRMHLPLGEVGRWLRRVVQGWLNYHAVPGNSERISRFVDEIVRYWLRVIRRRSERGKNRWTWARMQRLARKHLPRPHIIHPYPEQRFRARLKAGAV